MLGEGLLGRALTESELDGGAELAGVGAAVRVSGLGSLAALVHPAKSTKTAPQAAVKLERPTRCFASIRGAIIPAFLPE
ncbi:MAG TPA: hypothetical protein VFH20_13450 [Propionibacteriaceae bacterium]|nr:hypothetical protein [Propionibacteriaceae bacterium]